MGYRIRITDILITRVLDDDKIKAMVQIEINDALRIRGISVKEGNFGHFVSFPIMGEGSPYRYFNVTSTKIYNYIQKKVLEAYAKTGVKI